MQNSDCLIHATERISALFLQVGMKNMFGRIILTPLAFCYPQPRFGNYIKASVLISALCFPSKAIARADQSDDDISWFRKLLKGNKDVSNIFGKNINQDALFQDVGVSIHQLLDNGTAGKIGYGFIMGFSSGYCIKKVKYRRPKNRAWKIILILIRFQSWLPW